VFSGPSAGLDADSDIVSGVPPRRAAATCLVRAAASARALRSRLPWSTVIRAADARASATATASVAATVARSRTAPGAERMALNGTRISGLQAIAGTADGDQGGPPERFVDLATEGADVDLDDVGVAVVGEVPRLGQQLALGDDLAGPPGQPVQDGELLGG